MQQIEIAVWFVRLHKNIFFLSTRELFMGPDG